MKAKTNELKEQLAHCPVGDKEVVLFEIAVTPQYMEEPDELETEYVTWIRNKKGATWGGNYFRTLRAATRDFARRILDEMDRQED